MGFPKQIRGDNSRPRSDETSVPRYMVKDPLFLGVLKIVSVFVSAFFCFLRTTYERTTFHHSNLGTVLFEHQKISHFLIWVW